MRPWIKSEMGLTSVNRLARAKYCAQPCCISVAEPLVLHYTTYIRRSGGFDLTLISSKKANFDPHASKQQFESAL